MGKLGQRVIFIFFLLFHFLSFQHSLSNTSTILFFFPCRFRATLLDAVRLNLHTKEKQNIKWVNTFKPSGFLWKYSTETNRSNQSCLAASFLFPEQQNVFFYVLLTSFLKPTVWHIVIMIVDL